MNLRFRNFLIILIFFISVNIFFACSRDKEKWHPIPGKSSFVVEVNINSLTKKILTEKWKDFNITDLFGFKDEDTITKKNLLEEILESPMDSGIDLTENIYLFNTDSIWGICASLDDKDEFDNKLSSYSINKDKINGFNFAIFDSIVVAWNKTKCVFLYKRNSLLDRNNMEALLSIKKENSIYNNSQFTKPLIEDHDLAIWTNNYILLDQLDFFPNEILNETSLSYIDFNNGKISFFTGDILKSSYHQLFSTNASSKEASLPLSSFPYISKGVLNINTQELVQQVLKDTAQSQLNSLNISKNDLSSCFTGHVEYLFSSLQYSQKTFTSYELDEDFNKIETVATTTKVSPVIKVWLETIDSLKAKELLDKITKLGIINAKENIYTFDLTDNPYTIINSQKGILISTKDGSVKEEVIPMTGNNSYQSLPLHFSLDINTLSKNLPKETQLKNLSEYFKSGLLSINQDKNRKLNLNGEILLVDNEKNSLISILQLLKEYQKKQHVL